MTAQQVLDLAQLDPHTTHFDLLVAAAEKLQVSILYEPAKIAGLIDDVFRIVIKRIRDEDLPGEYRFAVIAERTI
ncbi:MAG TPA: hypothetical protein VKA78_01465, partial [Pyrinomonadaceae bacterium]|nr:hypothetical protein [Pyrinomonadaceae bacterium]